MNLIRQINEALTPAEGDSAYQVSPEEVIAINNFVEHHGGSRFMERFTDFLIDNGFDVDGDDESETEAAANAKMAEMGLVDGTPEWDHAYDGVYDAVWTDRNGGPNMVPSKTASAQWNARLEVLFEALRKWC